MCWNVEASGSHKKKKNTMNSELRKTNSGNLVH